MHVTIGGQELYYECTENNGSPVLMVMGFGMSCDAWRAQVKSLRPHHQVCTFDNRGTGRSGPVEQSYQMSDLGHDVIGLADHLGWERFHLVGVSMGGMVAQEVAVEHPDRLLSLTLIATRAGGVRGVPNRKAFALFLRANTSRGTKRLDTLLQLLYPPDAQAEAKALVNSHDVRERFGEPIPRRTALYQLRAVLKHDTRSRLHRLGNVPSLIVRPDQDILVPPINSDMLQQMIPGARMVCFSDAGHAVMLQRAAELNQFLLAHFHLADHA